ncbi:MAG: flavodoxin family protein [Dehalococcoidia bacterium]|jgi:multimeric flavodoxin WrbA
MKILVIMGSPRIGGNTDILMDEALRGARSAGAFAEKIIVDELDISPCREFNDCIKDGNCAIRDDMDDIYISLEEADAVIVGAPVFFYGLPAQLKALVDRCQVFWARKYVLKEAPVKQGRKGAFIGVGGTKGDKLFDGSRQTVKCWFDAIGVDYTEELFVRSVDEKGAVKKHLTAMNDAFELGKRLAE